MNKSWPQQERSGGFPVMYNIHVHAIQSCDQSTLTCYADLSFLESYHTCQLSHISYISNVLRNVFIPSKVAFCV